MDEEYSYQPPEGLTPPTGDDRVDAALAELSRLPGTPPDGHVAVLEEVHGRLRDILGELDDGRGERDDGRGERDDGRGERDRHEGAAPAQGGRERR